MSIGLQSAMCRRADIGQRGAWRLAKSQASSLGQHDEEAGAAAT